MQIISMETIGTQDFGIDGSDTWIKVTLQEPTSPATVADKMLSIHGRESGFPGDWFVDSVRVSALPYSSNTEFVAIVQKRYDI